MSRLYSSIYRRHRRNLPVTRSMTAEGGDVQIKSFQYEVSVDARVENEKTDEEMEFFNIFVRPLPVQGIVSDNIFNGRPGFSINLRNNPNTGEVEINVSETLKRMIMENVD